MATEFKDIIKVAGIEFAGSSCACSLKANLAAASATYSAWTWLGTSTCRTSSISDSSAANAHVRLDTLIGDLIARGLIPGA